MKHRVLSLGVVVGLVVIALFVWRGCDDRKDSQNSPRERTGKQESPQANQTGDNSTTLAVRVAMDLPFETDANFMLGGESSISPGPIDADPTASTYDPPVHPVGSVRSLKLYGKDIPLASTALHEGLLATVGFGEIEVLSKGFRGGSPILEYRAFPADIDKLKKAYPNTTAVKEANEARAKAENGDAEAQVLLALCYLNGHGVAKDDAEAVKWFSKGTKKTAAGAQLRIALCYQNGEGVQKDAAEAVTWCRKAAEQNNAQAQTLLAGYYLKGDGVGKDAIEAVKWCRKAAQQNNASAQLLLACCYLGEGGVEKDEVEAYKWLVLSAGQGDEDAKEVMASVGSKLSRDQIAEANKRAKTWLEQNKKTPSAD